MDAAKPSLHHLAKRLEALEAERDILRTLHRYGHCIDYGLEKEWVGLFTPDGAFDVRRRQGGGHREEGREALARYIPTHSRAPAKYHKHLLIEPIIQVDGDTAEVQSYFVRIDAKDGVPFIYGFGRYRDRMKKHDGAWRFKERIAEVEVRDPEGPSK